MQALWLQFGVILWMIMMPDMDDSANILRLNVWLTLVGAVTGIVAGILTKMNGNASQNSHVVDYKRKFGWVRFMS